jgi:HK97 family phage major capsid protein
MPTDFPNLIPHPVAEEVIASVADSQSGVMQLAQVVQMPSGVETMPVVSSAPASGFVDPAYGGVKPQGLLEWSPAVLSAAELATILGIPNAFIADTTFPVWGSCRDEIAKSFAGTFDRAALYGTNAPDGWPVGGLTAPAQATEVIDTDELVALDLALTRLEQNGIVPDGILGGAALKAALRKAMVAVQQPFDAAPAAVYGVPAVFSTSWDDAAGLALVGGFGDGVVVGVRADVTFDLSEHGVITDATSGAVLLNAFQQDSTLMRAYWRVALTYVKPLGPEGTPVVPLALAKVGTPVAARATARTKA